MAQIYQVALEKWEEIGEWRDEIIEQFEEEGEEEAFEVRVQRLEAQLAAAEGEEERVAWARAVMALVREVPEVEEVLEEVLGMGEPLSFGFDDETEAHGRGLYEQKRGWFEKVARIKQVLSQPAVDEKGLSFGERLRRLFGMKG